MKREVYFGKVLDNADPAKRGGLKLQVDEIERGRPFLGGEYVPPSFPFAGAGSGFFFVPPKNAVVEVELAADEGQAVEDLAARWRAVLYTDADAVPAEFLSDPTVRGGIKFGNAVLLIDSKTDVLALISPNVRLGTEAASHPVVRGDTYNSDLDAYLAAVDAALAAWAAVPPGGAEAALAAYATAVKSAISTFRGAASGWLSTRVKTE